MTIANRALRGTAQSGILKSPLDVTHPAIEWRIPQKG